MADESYLRFHIEPDHPIEIGALTGALGSLSRQYDLFIRSEGYYARAGEARLLVSSVSHGSIDITFVIDLAGLAATAMPIMLQEMTDEAGLLIRFATKLKSLLDQFLDGQVSADISTTAKDCDDVINITKPIAESGGNQSIAVFKGDVTVNVLTMNARDAQQVLESASRLRLGLSAQQSDVRQRTSLTWSQLARDAAKTGGLRSPDKGLISEIDGKPHAVLFTDEMAYIKREMIDDEENPYQKVYFVDVEIVRTGDKITAYRVIGYHGKDNF